MPPYCQAADIKIGGRKINFPPRRTTCDSYHASCHTRPLIMAGLTSEGVHPPPPFPSPAPLSGSAYLFLYRRPPSHTPPLPPPSPTTPPPFSDEAVNLSSSTCAAPFLSFCPWVTRFGCHKTLPLGTGGGEVGDWGRGGGGRGAPESLLSDTIVTSWVNIPF